MKANRLILKNKQLINNLILGMVVISVNPSINHRDAVTRYKGSSSAQVSCRRTAVQALAPGVWNTWPRPQGRKAASRKRARPQGRKPQARKAASAKKDLTMKSEYGILIDACLRGLPALPLKAPTKERTNI